MSFLIAGFPAFKPSDLDCIQAFRKEHDPLYGVVDPHFTIFFPVEDEIIPLIQAEMTTQLGEMKKIEFTLSRAIAHHDVITPAC
ncbi:MAG TPA: hypothetical protein VJ508_09840, partial [Saprospiraceae bacterium]|nr:hypothetical protein [Saprospiraceae bacterium]